MCFVFVSLARFKWHSKWNNLSSGLQYNYGQDTEIDVIYAWCALNSFAKLVFFCFLSAGLNWFCVSQHGSGSIKCWKTMFIAYLHWKML